MQANIHISIEGAFGLHLKGNYISFWHAGLPENVHCTISFNANAGKANFHVTKNSGNVDNKPKVTILEISKTELTDEKLRKIVIALFYKLFVQVKPIKFESKRRRKTLVAVMPNNGTVLSNKINSSFQKMVPRRSKRIRIPNFSFIEDELKAGLSPEDVVNAFKIFNVYPPPVSEQCILYTKGRIITLTKINERWYKFQEDVNLFNLLVSLTGTYLAKEIIAKIVEAIDIVKSAGSFEEIRHLSDPKELEIK